MNFDAEVSHQLFNAVELQRPVAPDEPQKGGVMQLGRTSHRANRIGFAQCLMEWVGDGAS